MPFTLPPFPERKQLVLMEEKAGFRSQRTGFQGRHCEILQAQVTKLVSGLFFSPVHRGVSGIEPLTWTTDNLMEGKTVVW